MQLMMTKRVLACLALIVACLAQVGLALPDLVAVELDLSPSAPTNGAAVTITVTIENAGPSDTDSPSFVLFTVDDREIDVVPLNSLRSGRTQQITTTWTATVGPHVLCVAIDPAPGRVEEADEENNTKSLDVTVRLDEQAMAILAPLRIAVARFDDDTGTGFVNVGEGTADALASRLTGIGLNVLDREELDAMMQRNGLNPEDPVDVAEAARRIGADLLVVGSVLGIDVRETSLSLGFLRVDSASADVRLSAQIVDAHGSRILSSVSAEESHEGATGFSIDLGQILSFLTAGSSEVCSGGLQLDRAWYNGEQTLLIGYRNEGGAAWFGIEIYSASNSFIRWLGWEYVDAGSCRTWSWDQRNASGLPVSPGIYTAKLWDGTSHIATAGFQVRPGVGVSFPVAEEITVGSSQFDDTVVGTAMNHAIDRLASALLFSMEDVAPSVAERQAPLAATQKAGAPQEGQIAAILPDGRIAVNLGASSGVLVGDVYEVIEVRDLVLDPRTSEIQSYDVVSIRGEIRIDETRERVSYAVPTSSFAPVIGDVVRATR